MGNGALCELHARVAVVTEGTPAIQWKVSISSVASSDVQVCILEKRNCLYYRQVMTFQHTYIAYIKCICGCSRCKVVKVYRDAAEYISIL